MPSSGRTSRISGSSGRGGWAANRRRQVSSSGHPLAAAPGHLFAQALQAQAQVPGDADVAVVLAADLGRLGIELDQGPREAALPLARVDGGEAAAHGEGAVGGLHRLPRQVAADVAEGQLVVLGQGALAAAGRRHRRPELLGQGPQRLPGSPVITALPARIRGLEAAPSLRAASASSASSGVPAARAGTRFGTSIPSAGPVIASWGNSSIAGPGRGARRARKASSTTLGDVGGGAGDRPVAGDRLEEGHLVESVEQLGGIAPVVPRVVLAGDQQHGHAVGVGLQQPGGGVAGAGAGHGEGDPHVAAGAGVAVGHHRGAVLVADQVVVDGAGAAAQQGVVDLQVLGAGHAEDAAHALGLQALDEEVAAPHDQLIIPAAASTPGSRFV